MTLQTVAVCPRAFTHCGERMRIGSLSTGQGNPACYCATLSEMPTPIPLGYIRFLWLDAHSSFSSLPASLLLGCIPKGW